MNCKEGGHWSHEDNVRSISIGLMAPVSAYIHDEVACQQMRSRNETSLALPGSI